MAFLNVGGAVDNVRPSNLNLVPSPENETFQMAAIRRPTWTKLLASTYHNGLSLLNVFHLAWSLTTHRLTTDLKAVQAVAQPRWRHLEVEQAVPLVEGKALLAASPSG